MNPQHLTYSVRICSSTSAYLLITPEKSSPQYSAPQPPFSFPIMAPIGIHGRTIDPSSPQGQKLLSEIPQCEYILVQVWHFNALKTLEENQIEIIELINDITYLCRYQPREYGNIKLDCVSSVLPYHPVWKVWDFFDHEMEKGISLVFVLRIACT